MTDSKPVAAQSITLGQIRELFETSTDANVVRAAICAMSDGMCGVNFLVRGPVDDLVAKQAHETLAEAWNANHEVTP